MNHKQTFIQALLIFCNERNLDAKKVASLSGVSTYDLNSKGKFNFTNQQSENLWKNIVQISGNELIGLHFGATMQIAALSVIGQIIQTSSNIKEALQHACSLVRLLTDFYKMQIEEKAKTFVITFQKIDGFKNFPTAQNQMGDFLIAFTLYELRGLLLENPKPISAGFPTYKKTYDREYDNILKCPTRKSHNYYLEFKKEYLQTKIITANYEIQSLLIEQINELQNPGSLNGNFSKKIFSFLIANSYLYSQSIELVAGNFNVSVRTLQRKLNEEGVSYLLIVEDVRKTLSIHYLKTSSSSIKEISSVMGYADPSGFVRAFKKWTGKSPSEYKNKIM